MAFRVLNDPAINFDLTALTNNKNKLNQIQEQLSTGLRLVRAANGESDMFIADQYQQTYVGLDRGIKNAQDGLTIARLADDTLGKVKDILMKIKDLTVQAANGNLTNDEKKAIQQEINNYVRDIANLIRNTKSPVDNTTNVFGPYYVHHGSHIYEYVYMNSNTNKIFSIRVSNVSTDSSPATITFTASFIQGKDATLNETNYTFEVDFTATQYTIDVVNYAESAIATVESLIANIDRLRNYYAGFENRLQNIIENNQNMSNAFKEAESEYRNLDYASAMAKFTKLQTVMQANVAAIAQGRQISQLVLQLLR